MENKIMFFVVLLTCSIAPTVGFGTVGNPINGSVIDNLDGTITFTPTPGFTDESGGLASFEYCIEDGNGGVDCGRVVVSVAPGNDPPKAEWDYSNTIEDTSVIISKSHLLSNDTDPDGDVIVFLSDDAACNATVLWFANAEDRELVPMHGGPGFKMKSSGNGNTLTNIDKTTPHGGEYSYSMTFDKKADVETFIKYRQVVTASGALLPDEAWYSAWYFIGAPQLAAATGHWSLMMFEQEIPDQSVFKKYDSLLRVGVYRVDAADHQWKFFVEHTLPQVTGTKYLSEVVAPLDEYFQVECYYRWDTTENGGFACYANDQLVAEDTKQTMIDRGGDNGTRQFVVGSSSVDMPVGIKTVVFDDAAISLHRLGALCSATEGIK